MNIAVAYAGLRALADCGTIAAHGKEPRHLKAAVQAGWAKYRTVWEGQRRWCHIYSLSIPRGRAINMLAPIHLEKAA